jgi:hypothetical protein
MPDRTLSSWILLVLGAGSIANGLFMLLASEAWFARIAAYTGPFNAHLVQDVGAAYATAGAASLGAALRPAWRVPLAAAAALFLGIHGLIHLVEVVRGVQPVAHLLEDLPGVYLPALLLAAIALRAQLRPAAAPGGGAGGG